MTADQIAALAQSAGSGGDIATAVAVALAESGGDPAARNVNSDGSVDRGLWQINSHWHPEVTDGCAFDAACNAHAAYVISNGWTDFSPWVTYTNGAYQRFLAQTQTLSLQPPARSLAGQEHVGEIVSTPWASGSWEVNQGWGVTALDIEPEGHGYAHWHAGVDVAMECGTVLVMPQGLSGVARSFDNPSGYGTALIVLVQGGPGIVLGHLRQRLVDDGAVLSPGDQLAVTNSTGNSTGCHLHFEVRPQDSRQPLGIARYGNDIDPSSWLLSASGSPTDAQLLAFNPGQDVSNAIGAFVGKILAGGEVLLGTGMLVGGLVAAAWGLRGGTPAGLQRATRRRVRPLLRPRPSPGPPTPRRPAPAAVSRMRPDLRPSEPAEPTRAEAEEALRSGRRLSRAEARALGAVPR